MACSQGQGPGQASMSWAPGSWRHRFWTLPGLPGMGIAQLVGDWEKSGLPGAAHRRCSKRLALSSPRAALALVVHSRGVSWKRWQGGWAWSTAKEGRKASVRCLLDSFGK